MEDVGLVAACRAGEGLKAVKGDGGDAAVVGVGEGDIAGDLRADGLGVVVVEDEAVDVGGEVFDGTGGVGLGAEVFAAEGDDIFSTLIGEDGANGAGAGGIRLGGLGSGGSDGA